MDFLRSKRPVNLQTLQRAYEDSYQASLRAILLEAQNNKDAALSAWQSTKRVIALQLSLITDTPKTSQESALMSNIMDIERQCYDRIAFLERGGPNNSPYAAFPSYSQDHFDHSYASDQNNGSRYDSYDAPNTSYSDSFSSFTSVRNAAEAYDNYVSPYPRQLPQPPPPLPPKVSLGRPPKPHSQPLFDQSSPFDLGSTFNPFPVSSQTPVPPPHQTEYKSLLDPGSTTSLLLGPLDEAPPSSTPPPPPQAVRATTPKQPRPPVIRRQVSRPSLSGPSGGVVPSQHITPVSQPVTPIAQPVTPIAQPVVPIAQPIPTIVKPTTPPHPAKSTPPLKSRTGSSGSNHFVNPKARSASSVESVSRTSSLTSFTNSSNDHRSPSPASPPPQRPMLLTLRSGKGTMKKFKEERKAASNATMARAPKPGSTFNANHNASLIAANASTGNVPSSLNYSNNKSITTATEKMSLNNNTAPKPRPVSGPGRISAKMVYAKLAPTKSPPIHAPKPTLARNGVSLSPVTSISRPTSTPVKAMAPKRPTPVSSLSASAAKKPASPQPKPRTPVPKPTPAKYTVTPSSAKPAARAAARPASRPGTKPAAKPVAAGKPTGRPTAKSAKPTAEAEVPETLDAEDVWLAEAKAKVAKVKGIDENAAANIFNDVVVKGDPVFWEDIAGLEKAKTSLKETVVYPFLRPDLFSGLREPAQGMLLFGPPGTGKTMLARAVATESNSTFFSISASSLTSKFLGESEKLVRALFLMARALAPSIIFVDEIDSLLASRSDSGEHETSRRIKTEFLVQWSALQHAAAGKEHEDVTRVLVLAATNLPWVIDEAARRRFVRRQYIPLPEAETRHRHLTQLLSRQKNSVSPEQFDELVGMTDGFSGSDLTALAKDAAMGPLRSLGEALLTTPTDQIRPIGFEDFCASLKTIRPSVSKEGLKVFEDWAAMFGSSGA